MKKPFILGILVTLVVFCSCDRDKKVRENPLIAEWTGQFGLPPFKNITPADYIPAIEYSQKLHLEEIEAIADNKAEPVFDNVILPLDSIGRRLELVLGVLTLTSSVDAGKELDSVKIWTARSMAAHNDAIFHNSQLFDRVKAVYEKRFLIDSLQARLTERTYFAFVRAGATLSDPEQAEIRRINENLAQLQTMYSNNLLDSRNETVVVADSSQIDGIPFAMRSVASKIAASTGMRGKFVFTQYDPVVNRLSMISKNSILRKEIFDASEKIGRNDSLHNNRPLARDIVSLRGEKARLLGYDSYAEYKTAGAMARRTKAVYDMLDGLWRPALDKNAEELKKVREVLNNTETLFLEPGDWSYYLALSRLRQTTIEEDQFEQYMTLDNVRLGAFELCNRLFGITFRPIAVDLYDDDCEAFEVFDSDNSHMGIMIFDNYTKPGKRSGSWVHCVRPRRPYGGPYADPVTCVVFNFTKPASAGRPASLSFSEIEQMFRQVGNALEIMFPDTPYAGLQRPDPDFVGITGELFACWAFEPQLVMNYALHYSTGVQTTRLNAERIYSGRNYRRGYDVLRAAASAYLAMDVHNSEDALDRGEEEFVREQLQVKRGLPQNIHPLYTLTNFGPAFGQPGCPDFYRPLWVASLGTDIFDMFRKSGNVFDRRLAQGLRDEVLSKGGGAAAEILFRNFRGRDVSLASFLVYSGMADESIITEPDSNQNQIPRQLQPLDTIPAPVPALELWKQKPEA